MNKYFFIYQQDFDGILNEYNISTIRENFKSALKLQFLPAAYMLSQIALDIWKIPTLIPDVEFTSISGEHFLDEDIVVTGTKPTSLIIDGNELKQRTGSRFWYNF